MVLFHQSMLGRISVKPTALPCNCAPQVAALINEVPSRRRCNRPRECREQDELLGRTPDGTWKAAKTNTYPSDMCRLRARALHQATEARWSNGEPPEEWSLPDEHVDFFIPLDHNSDFQRSTDCMHHRHLRPRTE